MSDSRAEDRPVAPHRDQPRGGTGLIIIDMINAFAFSRGEELRPLATEAAENIIALREQADSHNIPVIYVNDNFGEWHSESTALVEKVGERIAHPDIVPREKDYFVLKPQFSGFYATNLQVLLPKLGISRLILTGIATDICVLFTAGDAYMRDYDLWIPQDAVAAENPGRHEAALQIAKDNLRAEIAATSEMRLQNWLGRSQASGRLV